MKDFKTERFDLVQNNQYNFYKLYVDGVCQFDTFMSEIESNKRYMDWFGYIIRFMEAISDQFILKEHQFRHIESNDRNDIFEFKKELLRVYIVKQKPNIYIIFGGFKANQSNDIKKVKKLVNEFKQIEP